MAGDSLARMQFSSSKTTLSSKTPLILEILILLGLLLASTIQLHKLSTTSSTEGLSTLYLFLLALVSNAQFSEAVCTIAYGKAGNEESDASLLRSIVDREVVGLEAAEALVGVAQVGAMCLGANAVLLTTILVATDPSHFVLPIATVHGLAFTLLPLTLTHRPHQIVDSPTTATGATTAFLRASAQGTIPLCLVISVFAQMGEMRGRKGPGALSPAALVVQAMAFGALGWRWRARLKGEEGEETGDRAKARWWEWVEKVGYLPAVFWYQAAECAGFCFAAVFT